MGVMTRQFGDVPGYPQGSTWSLRREVSKAGVHCPPMGGISGTGKDGADSIVVNGGYEDDEDWGDEIIYTGAGGNDSTTKAQVRDQELTQPGNAGLVTSQFEGLPVRVVRGSKGVRPYSPASGFRYDGLYRVAEHWSEIGKSGFRIWRFRLVRLTDYEAVLYQTAVPLPLGEKNPTAVTGVVTRVVRDTNVSRSIKRLHNHRCQICDTALSVPGGAIAEGAHIRALGKPHNGPDTPDNLLCLCPNHHALFDQGGIYLEDDLTVKTHLGERLGPLKVKSEHPLNPDSIRYHRDQWGF